MDDERTHLVEAYWTFRRLAASECRSDRLAADDWLWAFDQVGDATARPDDSTLDLVSDLLHAAAADPVAVGTGPLEDLLAEHGPALAERIADRARADPLWREALASCRLDEPLAPSLSPLLPYLSNRVLP